MTVRTEHREVRTKTTEGQYSPVRLEQARLVSSLLYGTRHEIHDLDRLVRMVKSRPRKNQSQRSDLPSHIIKILNDFENRSGLKMNLSKTKAMWVGKNKNSLETPLGFEWC